jgi:hypothetical protein
MKTTTVRITRTTKVALVEWVDVDVVQDDDDHGHPEEIAQRLVEAQVAAGHDVDWFTTSEKIETYPRPIYETETVGAETITLGSMVLPPPRTPPSTN